MTNTLVATGGAGGGSTDPDDALLSPLEAAPKFPTPSTMAPDGLACDEPGCDYIARGVFPKRVLGVHKRKEHGIPGAQPKKKPAAKAEAPDKPKTAAAAKPTRPAATGRRRAMGDTLSGIVTALARPVGTVSVPTSRALAFAAPSLGNSIDGVLAGSFVDKKMLQPLAQGSEKWAALGASLGLPVMIFMLDRQPELFPVFESEIRSAMSKILVDSIPIMKRKREDERKVAAAVADLRGMDPALADSEDPIGELIDAFFRPAPAEESSETLQ